MTNNLSDQNNNSVGYIICEQVSENVEFKIKGEDPAGYVKAEGILQEGNAPNRNKRLYPTEELARNVMSSKIREMVETGNLKGEAGHPTDTSLARQSKIDPTLEQVWYTKLWMDGNYVMGQFMGTSNQLGQSFNLDLKRGQKPSFSLRAVGSLSNQNGQLVVAKMQMITYDRVYFPSHQKAYTTRIITTESADFKTKDVKYYDIDENNYFYDKQNEINSLSEAGNSVDSELEILQKISNDELNGFIIAESSNMNLIAENFDLLYNTMSLNENYDNVSIKTKNGSIVNITLEDAVKKEILFGMNNIFR